MKKAFFQMNKSLLATISALLAVSCSFSCRPVMTAADAPNTMLGAPIPVLLDFPDVRQATDYTCGPSAAQAVLYYYGISRREDVIAAATGATAANGTEPEHLASYLREQGLTVEAKAMTVAQIEGYLDRRIPVIVAFQAWTDRAPTDWPNDWSDGHYAVAIGYDADRLIFEDPSLMNRGFITKQEFTARWHDVSAKGQRYRHLGLAVSGRRPAYDRHRLLPLR
jgi:uncharacterized protein